jgi:hypothetical protein
MRQAMYAPRIWENMYLVSRLVSFVRFDQIEASVEKINCLTSGLSSMGTL